MLRTPIDIGDEDAFARAARAAAGRVLRSSTFAEAALPPGRRAWFAGFLVRSATGGLRRTDPNTLPELWKDFTHRLRREGIVATALAIGQGADVYLDPGTEHGRAAAHDRQLAHSFLQDRDDMRELVASALEECDCAVWKRYPAWFGHIEQPRFDLFAMRRAIAARWLSALDHDDTLLHALLDDAVAVVRHTAAISIARRLHAYADAQLLRRLHEAADDRTWLSPYLSDGDAPQRGCDVASALLDDLVRLQPPRAG